MGRFWGQVVSELVAAEHPDVVFVSNTRAVVQFLQCKAPVVYHSDAIWPQLEAYLYFAGLSPRSRRHGQLLDRNAVTRADAVVFSSRWAADGAIVHYDADPARLHVVPFGANLAPRCPFERPTVPTPLRVLLVARDWHRKGGDVAVGALHALHRAGIAAELVICGATPSPPISWDNVHVVGYLDRSQPQDSQRLAELYKGATVLVLPSRADCSPIVVCEAAAFSLPVIASAVGGIPELVIDGATGTVLPTNASPDDYAAAIGATVSNDGHYGAMARTARQRYEECLNWSTWAQAVTQIFESLVP
jgi:glycosyltransferase involved in cell wall biosynthesis